MSDWTEAEYEAALKRIDEIFEATPGSPEAVELDQLADAIQTYEDKAFPLKEPDPQAAAEFRCSQQGYHWPIMRIPLDPDYASCIRCGKVIGKMGQQ